MQECWKSQLHCISFKSQRVVSYTSILSTPCKYTFNVIHHYGIIKTLQRHEPKERNVAEANCANKEIKDRQTESCCFQVMGNSNVLLLYVAAQHEKQRLISLLEPPDKDFGISYTTLFGWSKVTNAQWLLTLFTVLLP